MADLIVLHGPPASGKLTTARQISALTGAAVFHNHLTLDVAKSVLEFGASEFWDLVDDIRLRSLAAHFEHGVGALLFTWCYEHPENYGTLDKINQMSIKQGGRILPVYLRCSPSDLEDRVVNQERQDMGKLCTVKSLRDCLSQKKYAPIPFENCLEIDSGSDSAEYNAQRVVDTFNL